MNAVHKDSAEMVRIMSKGIGLKSSTHSFKSAIHLMQKHWQAIGS